MKQANRKTQDSGMKQTTIADALSNAGVMAAVSKGGSTAKLVDKAAPVKALPKDLRERAAADGAVILGAHDGVQKAGVTMRERMIETALWLVADDKRMQWKDDGTSARQATYLECFQADCIRRRGLQKTDGYIRTLTTEFRTVITAIQHGPGLTVKEKVDGKPVTVTLKDRDAVCAKLREKKSYAQAVAVAREIKANAPVIKAANQGKPMRMMKSTQIANVWATRFDGKLDANGLMQVQGLLLSAIASAVLPGNQAYFASFAVPYGEAVVKALTESKAAAGSKDTMQSALAALTAQRRETVKAHVKALSDVSATPQSTKGQRDASSIKQGRKPAKVQGEPQHVAASVGAVVAAKLIAKARKAA